MSTCKFIYLLQIHFAKRCMFYVPYTYTATQRRNTAPISSNKTAETVGQSIYYLPYTKGSRCITCPCLHITSLFLSAAGPIVSCIIVQATLPSIYTSGQSNLTTGRIAAAHGRFNGIRQVAPACTRHNNASLAQSSPNPKRHLDRFSHFCRAHNK